MASRTAKRKDEELSPGEELVWWLAQVALVLLVVAAASALESVNPQEPPAAQATELDAAR